MLRGACSVWWAIRITEHAARNTTPFATTPLYAGLWTNPEGWPETRFLRAFVPKMCTPAGTSDTLGSIAEQEKPGFSALSKLQYMAYNDHFADIRSTSSHRLPAERECCIIHVLFRAPQGSCASPKSRFRFSGSANGWSGSSWAMRNCTTKLLSHGNAVRWAFNFSSSG